MKILLPGLSCVLDPLDTEIIDGKDALQRALELGYKQIYQFSKSGTVKHHFLNSGRDGKPRFVTLPVASIPGVALPDIKPSVSFLPDGKIPYRLLEEVMEFFGEVIRVKGTKLEAMIWILWNQTDGYHLFVPNQRVGPASAHYDWSGLPADSIVVMDIHAHADFNAFFSGTDDNDDDKGIRFSGVVGHNTRKREDRDRVYRFNYLGTKIPAKEEEIFERVEAEIKVPNDWVEKVERIDTTRYSPGHTTVNYHGGNYGKWRGPTTSNSNTPVVNWKQNTGPVSTAGGSSDDVQEDPSEKKGFRYPEDWEHKMTPQQRWNFLMGLSEEDFKIAITPYSKKDKKRLTSDRETFYSKKKSTKSNPDQLMLGIESLREIVEDRSDSGLGDGVPNSVGGGLVEDTFRNGTGLVRLGDGSLMMDGHQDVQESADEFVRRQIEEEAAEELARLQNSEKGSLEDDPAMILHDYHVICVDHGVDAANAMLSVEMATATISTSPELSARCAREFLQIAGEKLTANDIRGIIDALPEKVKLDLQSYGL